MLFYLSLINSKFCWYLLILKNKKVDRKFIRVKMGYVKKHKGYMQIQNLKNEKKMMEVSVRIVGN